MKAKYWHRCDDVFAQMVWLWPCMNRFDVTVSQRLCDNAIFHESSFAPFYLFFGHPWSRNSLSPCLQCTYFSISKNLPPLYVHIFKHRTLLLLFPFKKEKRIEGEKYAGYWESVKTFYVPLGSLVVLSFLYHGNSGCSPPSVPSQYYL